MAPSRHSSGETTSSDILANGLRRLKTREDGDGPLHDAMINEINHTLKRIRASRVQLGASIEHEKGLKRPPATRQDNQVTDTHNTTPDEDRGSNSQLPDSQQRDDDFREHRSRKRPPPSGEDDEPDITPANRPKSKRKKPSQAERNRQDERETDLDSLSVYCLDGDGGDTTLTSNSLVLLRDDLALEAKVRKFWEDDLQQSKKKGYLKHLAGWVRNKRKAYCVGNATISNVESKREGQTAHQACNTCVKNGRPCLIFIDEKIVLLPQRSISKEARFIYF